MEALHGSREAKWILEEKLTMPQFRVLVLATRRPWPGPDKSGGPGRPGPVTAGGPGPVTAGGLARHLRLTPPTVTGIVDRLHEAGLVVRVRSATDRRVVEVTPTEKGRQLVAEATAAQEERLRRLFSLMAEDDAQALLRGLEGFRAAIPNEGPAEKTEMEGKQ